MGAQTCPTRGKRSARRLYGRRKGYCGQPSGGARLLSNVEDIQDGIKGLVEGQQPVQTASPRRWNNSQSRRLTRYGDKPGAKPNQGGFPPMPNAKSRTSTVTSRRKFLSGAAVATAAVTAPSVVSAQGPINM